MVTKKKTVDLVGVDVHGEPLAERVDMTVLACDLCDRTAFVEGITYPGLDGTTQGLTLCPACMTLTLQFCVNAMTQPGGLCPEAFVRLLDDVRTVRATQDSVYDRVAVNASPDLSFTASPATEAEEDEQGA